MTTGRNTISTTDNEGVVAIPKQDRQKFHLEIFNTGAVDGYWSRGDGELHFMPAKSVLYYPMLDHREYGPITIFRETDGANVTGVRVALF